MVEWKIVKCGKTRNWCPLAGKYVNCYRNLSNPCQSWETMDLLSSRRGGKIMQQFATLRLRGRPGRDGGQVHWGTVLGDAFSLWRQICPSKQSHNALWQPSRPSLPRNLKVANSLRHWGWCANWLRCNGLRSYLTWSRFNPGVNAMFELSLLLVLFLVPIGFSRGTPVFPSPQKPKFDQER